MDNDLDKETRLGMLASAILDGTPIDWPAAKSTGDTGDQDVVRQLQIVAEIAALHRNLDPTRSSAPRALQGLDETRPAIAWGHLRLLEPVGRGTFGEVYRAWDTHLDREVALKLLRAGPVTDDPSASLSDPARVVNEGRLLAKVRHPNVITVYGAEPREGRVGLWMEFIRGKTLHQIVEQQGAFGARETASVGIDLCHALAAVHRAGLLHRDMTARNVMREEGGRVVLMDFGAGHEYSGASQSRSNVTGTPLYMAPELFTGGVADQRTDIYALGTLLYYLVTRTFPVTGRSLTEVRDAHVRGERARLRDVRPDLPAAFVRAVEQATAVDPAQRFATAGDLEAALDAATRGAAGTATTTVAPGTSHGWRLAIAATALATSIIAATWAFRSDALGGGGATPPANAVAAMTVTARRLSPPPGVTLLSNPSDDGRYVAGTVIETSDAAIVDLTTGTYRPLGVVNADSGNGYASMTTLSPDASNVAVSWYTGYKGSLHVIRSDGSGHRVLIEDADHNVYQWSRDGSLILTAIAQPDGTNTISLVAAADGAVRTVHTLGPDWPEMMSFSPDARYVAYDYPQAGSSHDRDVFVLDTHTGAHWPVATAPGQDTSPLWSPSGDAIVFFSDRTREFSAWTVAMQNGRPQGGPQLVKADIGRVWPRGLTRDGALYHSLTTGFAEVYVASIDGSGSPRPIAPRQALSNFYPAWSPDGRLIAYSSERRAGVSRELWIHDTVTGLDAPLPKEQKLGVPAAWSPDGQRILAFGLNDGRLFKVDRASGDTTLVGTSARRGRWLPEGIVFISKQEVILQDANSGRQIRRIDFSDPGIAMFDVDLSGRMATAVWKNGRVGVTDVVTGTTRDWAEPGVTRVGFQAASPRTSAVAYTAFGKDATGEWVAVKVQEGSGEPRELLRTTAERIVVWGWTGDGKHILVARWKETSPGGPPLNGPTTLFRVPVNGGAPIPTGLAMEGLRDVSIHPDGRQIAFNAGFKLSEFWAMDNLFAK